MSSFALTHHRSTGALFSSVASTSAAVVDPPRPAKEGYEWVWFPAGYWAEREIVEVPTKESLRIFRHRKRSGKSNSESPSRSPATLLAATPHSERVDKLQNNSSRSRSVSRMVRGSESAGSPFSLNHTVDAPLHSPYLTEEAHVQSLQWPSVDTAPRTNSISENSMLRTRAAPSPTPLHISSAKDEVELGVRDPSPLSGQSISGTPSGIVNAEPPALIVTRSPGVEPKTSLINRWVLLGHRQRRKIPHASGDRDTIGDTASSQPGLQVSATDPLRDGSPVDDKRRMSLKKRAINLFKKSRQLRKLSSSSGASEPSSLHGSVRGQSPTPTLTPEGERIRPMAKAWDSEYPGGEAVRIHTPRITRKHTDQPPRSFFSDLTPPSTIPLSRQKGLSNLKKTTLSKSYTPGDSSGSVPPRQPDILRNRRYYSDIGFSKIRDNKKQTPRGERILKLVADSGSGRIKTAPTPKEWWEAEMPTSFAMTSQRPFKFDLPEHLPTSPMCPANKRHPSGGTGVCVYHGRAKSIRRISAMSSETWQDEEGRREYGEYGDDREFGTEFWR
ncbi:putative RNA polymerase ii accessory cdc73 protein [Rosellinia necatrix]|uniref:Putative RNA polymerase ii accessory cdc73 protein n=1 Tax=Rosellinia necatrix TaxID=77044 RepID=A0A1W2TE94_ROSNE|nr:putative RNA polymerase ii accessory cdc73 protein [Rosellinia necatrix]